MTLSLIMAAVALMVVVLLTLPLIRSQKAAPLRLDFDLAVYRDQLDELSQDQTRGLLSPEQSDAARIEIERRMLASSQTAEKTKPADARTLETGRRLRLAAAMVILVGLPIAAFALYGTLGSPGLPGQPAAERAQERDQQIATVHNMVRRLEQRLEQNPNDAEGWQRLSAAMRIMGDGAKAKAAAQKAVDLRPGQIEPLLLLAQAQLAAAPDDSLPADFLATLKQVLKIDGDNPQALYYLGLSQAEAGDTAGTRRLWSKLLSKLPPEAPERAELQKQIDALPKN